MFDDGQSDNGVYVGVAAAKVDVVDGAVVEAAAADVGVLQTLVLA